MRLPEFTNLKALVCGDRIMDVDVVCRMKKISAEAPIPVFEKTSESTSNGAASYVHALISSLAKTNFCALVTPSGYSVKTRYKDEQGRQVFRCDQDSITSKSMREEFTENVVRWIDNNRPKVVVLCDYTKGAFDQYNIETIIKFCRSKKIKTIVDTKRPFLYESCFPDVMKYNKRDYELVEIGLDLGSYTVITDGENGCTLIANKDLIDVPAFKSKVKDVTGAGDVVTSMLACCLAEGIDPKESCVLAMQAASVAVENDGCYVVSRYDLKDQFESIDHPESKLIDKNELKDYCDYQISRAKKVAITNGCFDIIHHGHLKLLADAYNEGDKLVVAINSDESVKKLKGDKRPINSLDKRVKQLCNMPIVDRVVVFHQDTPEKLYSILPQKMILVKGVDREDEEVVGESRFDKVVKIVRDPKEQSTTSIIEGYAKDCVYDKLIEFIKELTHKTNSI